MFVVALYHKGMEYEYDDYLVSLHESTESSTHKIEEIKKAHQINTYIQNRILKHMLYWDEINPKPNDEIEAMALKPKFDHNRASDKLYNKQHQEAVNIWKETIYNPAKEKVTEHMNRRIERSREVTKEWKNVEFSPDSPQDYAREYVQLPFDESVYYTKILEVYK